MTVTLPEPHILRYTRWLRERRGLDFDATTTDGYDRLWRWSCSDLSAFWQSIWDYFGVASPTPHEAVLGEEKMPGASWFAGAQVNYAQHVFSHAEAADAAGRPAIVFRDEAMQRAGRSDEIAWPELRRRVAALAAALEKMGVQPGDRVAAFMPNTPQTAIAFLACASVGAVWSVCSPDMGPLAVLDRFRQIAPKVLIACDGYRYGGAVHDRAALVEELLAGLPSVADVIVWRQLDPAADLARFAASPVRRAHDFDALVAAPATFAPRWLPFDHPLWIVYSSGTTGLPKAIVHGHGGVMLESLKAGLHNDVGAERRSTATAITGTARPAGSCGTRRWAHCSAAPPCACTTAARPDRAARWPATSASSTGRRSGASPPRRRPPSSAPARRSMRAA